MVKNDMQHGEMNHMGMNDMQHGEMNHMGMNDMQHGEMNHMQMMNHGGHMMNMGDMKKKLWVSIVLMIPLLLISPVGGYTLLHFTGSSWLALALGTVIFFYGGSPFFSGARGEFKSRKPAMMMLITLGITVAYVYSVYATFIVYFGGQAMSFWFELATLIVIMLIGHIIEMNAIMRAGDAVSDLATLVPKMAHLENGQDVPIAMLKIDDVVVVKENERIPADGSVLSATLVDESMITGESRAVKKAIGDQVFGGSLNQNTPFTMKVKNVGADSFLAQVAALVAKAQNQKSAAENLADRVAGYLFYAALIVGILAFIFWSVTTNFSFALLLAVSVFVIACPHALGLAVPLIVARLTNISAKNGLLIQNRTSLEKIDAIKYALMDKTGTLTDGKFVVRDVVKLSATDVDVLQMMAALETQSTHPIAQAILKAADGKILPATEVQNIPGIGLTGQIAGQKYSIVNAKYLYDHQLAFDQTKVAAALKQGLTVSFLLLDNQVLGYVILGDSLRSDAVAFVKGLIAQGITPVMLTGDNQATAAKISASLGIEAFQAELKPADKATIVKKYQEQGAVLFIGDGVNDSPALATADLGIAIGAGTSVAINSADVVLVNSNPSDVLDLLLIAHKSNRKMKENLWFGAGYNIIAIPLAAGVLYPTFHIYIAPLVAAILMSISTVIVAINAMTLRYDK
ncbi:copper-potassium transporting ATPase B [Weissella oryzae SG25]|uniref:P-type Cu(+) transporter n=1 Tax=Weissella oryzae (strain DSM 25784 / JCM 18191 / LMG 30913 / SG25) TaxID=1329250 RepID=A0A069CQS2_WEIOS|nr:copper-translocating P-type ATPase [Weissella oryzae]GAK30045.1 copper-potassium transporting ATPase B [Weissella oryzae SG25]